jgi:hypothetical protein
MFFLLALFFALVVFVQHFPLGIELETPFVRWERDDKTMKPASKRMAMFNTARDKEYPVLSKSLLVLEQRKTNMPTSRRDGIG